MKLPTSLVLGSLIALATCDVGASPQHQGDQLNSTGNGTSVDPSESSARNLKAKQVCTPPANSVGKWWYPNHVYYMATCDYRYDKHGAWTMLNAYRSGGDRDVHWRYIKKNDDYYDCLKDWTYYGKDGVWVVAKVQGYSTTLGDKSNSPWCAMPVYRKGGVRGNQWDYCTCV